MTVTGFWKHPLLPIGVLLLAVGIGNWWISLGKVSEYSRRLAASREVESGDLGGLSHLDARTNASLLRRLHRGPSTAGIAGAKRDFYQLVNNGGRLIAICGFGVLCVGAIRYWNERGADSMDR
jgi:hypothetical protein